EQVRQLVVEQELIVAEESGIAEVEAGASDSAPDISPLVADDEDLALLEYHRPCAHDAPRFRDDLLRPNRVRQPARHAWRRVIPVNPARVRDSSAPFNRSRRLTAGSCGG